MKRLVIAAALALGAASAVNAQTVTNGSFEEGPDPNGGLGFITITAPNSSITGWTVDSGSIDYIGSYWTAQDGSRSVDLAGDSLGSISQLIAGTVADQLYTVSFWASKNPDGGAPDRTGTVSFGGENELFTYSLVNDRTNMNWALYTFDFLATGPSTTLTFAADASAGCCYGPALDNVSIAAAVPEPSTWAMMLFGFGAIGYGLRRRKSLIPLAQVG